MNQKRSLAGAGNLNILNRAYTGNSWQGKCDYCTRAIAEAWIFPILVRKFNHLCTGGEPTALIFDDMRFLLTFLGRALFIYIAWFVLYDFYLKPEGTLDRWLTEGVGQASLWSLQAMGYNLYVKMVGSDCYMNWSSNNATAIHIARNCNGQVLYALFVGFIISFPGENRQKLWYIPLGIIIITLLNILRVDLLVLTRIYYPDWLAFNHKYLFTITLYACIFVLWYQWVDQFSGLKKKKLSNA